MNKIIFNNKYYSIFSKYGKQLLRQYIKSYIIGGSNNDTVPKTESNLALFLFSGHGEENPNETFKLNENEYIYTSETPNQPLLIKHKFRERLKILFTDKRYNKQYNGTINKFKKYIKTYLNNKDNKFSDKNLKIFENNCPNLNIMALPTLTESPFFTKGLFTLWKDGKSDPNNNCSLIDKTFDKKEDVKKSIINFRTGKFPLSQLVSILREETKGKGFILILPVCRCKNIRNPLEK